MKFELRSLFEKISPILINPHQASVTISLSKRFILFEMLRSIVHYVEHDPYLNFLSILKHYKLLRNYLHGSIKDLYGDRNASYFKRFFYEHDLYLLVKQAIEWAYSQNQRMNITISREGVIMYDNYKRNDFNFLLLTIHSGRWMPKDIAKKQIITYQERICEEDIDIDKIYGPLALTYGGIWIDSSLSRFACDYNRSPERAIYADNSEQWVTTLWKEPVSSTQRKSLMDGYNKFYFTLSKLIEAYRFNIILDGHSMKDRTGLPDISFGTRYIPKFYVPIVQHMQDRLTQEQYRVEINNPYAGGYILRWLQERFPQAFICSMEINKRLYMSEDRIESQPAGVHRLSTDLLKIFDFLKQNAVMN